MTDEQIIKAWEKILSAGDAPIGKHWLCGSVTTEFAKATLDTLNRQKAEIERSQRILNSYALQYGTVADKKAVIDKAKSEAIKDFAERVKEKTLAMVWSPDLLSTADYIECIDSIVKETVGER